MHEPHRFRPDGRTDRSGRPRPPSRRTVLRSAAALGRDLLPGHGRRIRAQWYDIQNHRVMRYRVNGPGGPAH